MTKSTSAAEEELEKQYKEYRQQFEQWKEKNKNSVGTAAYIAYVEQFEAWEKDVEKRRELLRGKEMHRIQNGSEKSEPKAAGSSSAIKSIPATHTAKTEVKKEPEEDQLRKQQLEADAAAQAAAYAQHQQLYLAHHQAAIQKEQQMRKAAGSSPQADVGRAAIHTAENKPSDDLDPAHMAEMMQHMAQVAQMMMGEQPSQGTYEGESTTYSQPSVQVTAHSAQQQNSPPQLWGGDRIDYGANDPLWKKWGPRAAPPYCKLYRPPPPDYQPTPGWLTIAQMKEQKLVFPSQVAMPPPPIVSRF